MNLNTWSRSKCQKCHRVPKMVTKWSRVFPLNLEMIGAGLGLICRPLIRFFRYNLDWSLCPVNTELLESKVALFTALKVNTMSQNKTIREFLKLYFILGLRQVLKPSSANLKVRCVSDLRFAFLFLFLFERLIQLNILNIWWISLSDHWRRNH